MLANARANAIITANATVIKGFGRDSTDTPLLASETRQSDLGRVKQRIGAGPGPTSQQQGSARGGRAQWQPPGPLRFQRRFELQVPLCNKAVR
jgi:hypothetical protein